MQLYGLRLVSILPMLAPMCAPVSSLAMSCTGSGSARSLTTNHPYGPSLVVGSYLVWDATGRELWETALLSTTRRLPVREYWTQ